LETGNERINLLLSSPDSKYYSAVILLKDNGLRLTLTSAEKANNKKLGFRFDTKTSGHWYGGAVVKAHLWPLEANKITVDPFYATSNQTSPIWYTSGGAGIFAETYNTMGYSFNRSAEGVFELFSKNTSEFNLNIASGKNIKEAYYLLTEKIGKPSVVPPADFFIYPQFNTWIEFMTMVNQAGILKYTQEIKKNNFPSCLFIIDDKWTRFYGDPEFDTDKFPDPIKMIGLLHENNFRIVLWITPFIEKDSKNFRYASDNHFLIMNLSDEEPYFTEWWNGTAALVDLSNPAAYSWFLGLLEGLKIKYGVDGFKLDAGDAEYLDSPYRSFGNITPNEYTDLFASLGKHFEANELRVSWMAQSMGLIQRLRDKAPSWSETDGINSLIPHALTLSLLGYSYACPDMIGGGLDSEFKNRNYKFDEELFVRWTEASALMPMMQYSLAPWKLSKENVAICRKYSELHVSLGDYIYSLAEQSRIDGSPIIRPLFFEFPDDAGTFLIKDQFMLGSRFLVAPVLQKGALSRKIYLPAGTWIDFRSGKIFRGAQTIESPAPLDVLPVFVKVE
jgi:alpha-glucosidase (family GH31 glycosyl hydrolase)